MSMLHKAIQNRWCRLALAVAATLLYAIGVNWFIVPMGLYTGGLLGFCQVARTLIVEALGLSPNVDFSGILYLAANVPILLLAWQALGRGFLVRTAVCTVTSSLFLSLVPPPAAPLVEETLTNCVLGGILVGFSLGIVLTCGCSTGGLDILGLWLAKKGKGFSVGRFSLSFNALLYTLCAVLFGLRAAIYSIIYTVFCALFIDRGHQQNITEQVLIFTKDEDPELPRNIMARLGRGVTYWEGKGAYTGESSCDMLKSAGCTYCIIGHSERRDYFHETDEDENKKAKALVAAGIVPVFCCGEPEEVREAGTYVKHVTDQVKAGLAGLEISDAKQLVVAYEPIWAIGTGKTATADDAQEVCGAIRETLKELFGAELADGIRVLYGGSAKPGNIAELVAKPDVDGALVGGASLKAEDFSAMVVKAGE